MNSSIPEVSTPQAGASPPALKHFRLITQGLDIAPALSEIARHKTLWPLMDLRQRYGPSHKDTETIALRGPPSLYDIQNNLESMNYTVWNSFTELGKLFLELVSIIGAREVGRVMLVRLKPMGIITPHRDEGVYARYYSRFHLALASELTCSFSVGDETIHMAPGELWWFNHQLSHHVINLSPIPRIHLIFDSCAPGYTGALIP